MSLFISTHTIKNTTKYNELEFTPYSVYIDNKGRTFTESQYKSFHPEFKLTIKNINGLKKNDKIWILYDDNIPFAFSYDEGSTYYTFNEKVSFYQKYKIKKAIKRKKGKLTFDEKFYFISAPLSTLLAGVMAIIFILNPHQIHIDINLLFTFISNIIAAIFGFLTIRQTLISKTKTERFLNEKEIMNIDLKINEEIMLLPHTREVIYKSKNLKKQNIKN